MFWKFTAPSFFFNFWYAKIYLFFHFDVFFCFSFIYTYMLAQRHQYCSIFHWINTIFRSICRTFSIFLFFPPHYSEWDDILKCICCIEKKTHRVGNTQQYLSIKMIVAKLRQTVFVCVLVWKKKIIYIHVYPSTIDVWRERRKMMCKPALNDTFIVGHTHTTWEALFVEHCRGGKYLCRF